MGRCVKLFVPGFLVLSAAAVVVLLLRSASPDVPAAWSYQVVSAFDHDPQAFTQGLIFEDGFLFEGTGLPGRSDLRKVELSTGNVLQRHKLPDELFGEGITVWGSRVVQLTYQSRVGLVYDKKTFELLRKFSYPTEGWGLTHDGRQFIMSDGTPMLYFLDPKTFAQVHKVMVLEGDTPVWGLNELEYVEGQIFANVWPTERIVRIAPDTGKVVGWIDMQGLLSPGDRTGPEDVLNGIAYDATNGRLFVTGKLWSKLFEIKLVRAK